MTVLARTSVSSAVRNALPSARTMRGTTRTPCDFAMRAADSPISPALVQTTYEALSATFVTQSLILVATGGALLLIGIVVGAIAGPRSTRRPAR